MLFALVLLASQQAVLAVPTVVLSEAHQAMALVGVGDAMPDVAGATTGGRPAKLADLLGRRATVLAFTRGAGWQSETMLADLGRDAAGAYSEKGVAVLAVAPAGSPAPPKGITSVEADPARVAEAVGPGKMPRVYVLAADGKVAWFDLEYSASTRRELHETLAELTSSETR